MKNRCPVILLTMLLAMSALGGPASLGAVAEPQQVMDRLYEPRIEAESQRYLSLNWYNVALDHAKAQEPQRFTIISPDDPAYAQAAKVHPVRSGGRTRTLRVALRKEMLVKHTAIFLELPTALKPGCTYRVDTAGLESDLPALEPLRFAPDHTINDNLRVNQMGYLPDMPKRAYVGQYMGILGPMPLESSAFEVVDAQGQVVFRGQGQRREVNENLVGQQLWELDFSAVAVEGTYHLRMAELGVSYPFDISERALAPVYANLMRGHYHQRCGMAIDESISRHHRQACHLDDAFLDAAAEKTKFVAPKTPPLYPAPNNGARQDATRGHHDAGDYGKYTSTGAGYTHAILHAMSVFPDKFREDNFGLPYSGNGIPDLLDEAKWELDWLENMQDPADGGVFGVIRPQSGGYEHHMPPKESKRYFFPKDTVFTAAYAAALARAARDPHIRQFYPDDAPRYLQKAHKAWEFLQANDRYVQWMHYGSIFEDWDERCWAALELYAATGETTYHDYFLKQFDPSRKRWGWWGMFEAVGHSVNSYVTLSGQPTDPDMLQRCRTALREAADEHVLNSTEHPYRLVMPRTSIRHGRYGWIFPGDLAGYDLLMAYAQFNDNRYRQTALETLNYTCGANPSGYFLQTGLGWKRNIEAVDDESNSDQINEPVPGLPLGIGSESFYWVNRYGKRLGEGTYPDPGQWPLMNRWYDGFNVTSEFTMGPMARETIVAAWFAGPRKGALKGPKVSIQADRLEGPAPLTVRFEAVTQPGDGRIRQVFWDFQDETFSTSMTPVHQFTQAGRTSTVAVTVIDSHGLSHYHTVEVHVLPESPTYRREPRKPTADTLLLLPMDGSLEDVGPHKLTVQVTDKKGTERSPMSFTAQPPRWMAGPKGAALRLDGAEHFTVTFAPELVKDWSKRKLSINLMVYIEEWAGYGYPDNPMLLGLQSHWDSWVGWRQDTWDKVGAPRFAAASGVGISSAEMLPKFPTQRWCEVEVRYDGNGLAEFLVDGQVLGQSQGTVFRDGNKPATFNFGPFRGWIDDLHVTLR